MRWWILVVAMAAVGCVASEGRGDRPTYEDDNGYAPVSSESPWAAAAERGFTIAARLPIEVDDLVLQDDGGFGHAVMEGLPTLGGDGIYTCAFLTTTGRVTDDQDLSDFDGGFETVGDAGSFGGTDTTLSITDHGVNLLESHGDGDFGVAARIAVDEVVGAGLWDGGWVGLRYDGHGDCDAERYLATATQPAEVAHLDGPCDDRPDVEVDAAGRAYFTHGGQVWSWGVNEAPAALAPGRAVAWTGRSVAIADDDGTRVLGGPATAIDGRVRQVLAVGGLSAYVAVGTRIDGTGAAWLVDSRDGGIVDEMFLPDAKAPVAASRGVGLFAFGGDDVTMVQVGL